MLGAGITGFYMTRLMLMTFFTNKRWADEVHPHESPKVMTIPLIVLAALSVLGGVMIINDWIVDYLQPVTGTAPEESPPIPGWSISVIVVCIVAVGVAVAWRYVGQHDVPRVAPQDVSFVTRGRPQRALRQRDQRRPGRQARCGPGPSTLTVIDERGIDGAVEGGALGVAGTGMVVRRLQNGFVRSYALSHPRRRR